MTDHDTPTQTESSERSPRSPRSRRRDRGSTLPELLITVMLLGLIVSSLASAVIVTCAPRRLISRRRKSRTVSSISAPLNAAKALKS